MAAKKDRGRAGAKGKAKPERGDAAKADPAAKGAARAAVLAARMPLVHYPASARLHDWIEWPGLLSRSARGAPPGAGPFERLREDHVFFYGGPPCYSRRDSVGDSVLYLDPSAEEGKAGSATPFDSGALEDPTPKLRPWAQQPVDDRWRFLASHMVPLAEWRARFERWLAHSYDEPDRYVETNGKPWEDGQPDRSSLRELLEHNGARGYEKHGPDCADRRAWTWEVRVAERMPFARVRALHVPARRLRKAADAAYRLRWASGFLPEVLSLRRGVEATPERLYADSGRVLRELIGR